MNDRQQLLGKLRIDREAAAGTPEASGLSGFAGGWRLGLIGGAIAVIAMIGYFTLNGDGADGIADTSPDDSIAAQAAITPAAGQDASGQGNNGQGAAQSPRPTARAAVLNASGYVTARRMATVSSEITGRIMEVLIEEGMRVEEGQIVARLDDSLAQVDLRLALARVVAADADVASAVADMKEGERVLVRARELEASSFTSEAELTEKEARVEALTARLDRARADAIIARLEVERREETVDRYLVRAPFSGVIVDKAAQAGEIVSPISAGGGFTRTGIGTLVDMDSLEIEVDVNESYIGRVSPGQQVTATLDAYPDWQIPASVIAIIPTADRAKATVRVRIAINAKDQRILPDMGVKVVFHGDDE